MLDVIKFNTNCNCEAVTYLEQTGSVDKTTASKSSTLEESLAAFKHFLDINSLSVDISSTEVALILFKDFFYFRIISCFS